MKRNKASLEEQPTKWHVYTDKNHVANIEKWIKEVLPNTIPDVKDISETRRYIDASQSAFVMSIEECIKDKSPLLFAPPDILFGDGSINGLLKSLYEKDAVATVAHIRATSSLLKEIKQNQKDITNPQLVSLAWKHLHRCWIDAELGHPRQNQWGTGVCWQKIEDNLYSVVHRLPTPYLMYFTDEDLQYFKIQSGFGHFDHRWPGDILMKRGRQRTITSSDVAFMIEITEPEKNISNIPGDKNDFWQHHYHNEINKQILVTLRGENE